MRAADYIQNDLDPDQFDSAVRDMLKNWATWQQGLPPAIPSPLPTKQPMFREMKSGYNSEDSEHRKNIVIARIDEALVSESLIVTLQERDQSVLERYFIRHQNTVVCAGKMGMSRRQFERWLNTAIGKFAARVEDSDDAMAYVFQIISGKLA